MYQVKNCPTLQPEHQHRLSDCRDALIPTVHETLCTTSVLSHCLRTEPSCMCMCAYERKQSVFKRNTGVISQRLCKQTKTDTDFCLCFSPTALRAPVSLYLSPCLSFSLRDADSVEQSERSRLDNLLYPKHNPLFESNISLLNLLAS